MTITKVPMTVYGAQQLRNELEHLKQVVRPKIIADIAEARAHGDLKENAEYHAARETQGFVEGRIMEIEAKLSAAQIIDVRQVTHHNKVVFGATVSVEKADTPDLALKYTIVGEDEADLQLGKISVQSPLARAMIGKMVDDEFVVSTPDAVVQYVITNIEYLANAQ